MHVENFPISHSPESDEYGSNTIKGKSQNINLVIALVMYIFSSNTKVLYITNALLNTYLWVKPLTYGTQLNSE